jgi:hypothetical protein
MWEPTHTDENICLFRRLVSTRLGGYKALKYEWQRQLLLIEAVAHKEHDPAAICDLRIRQIISVKDLPVDLDLLNVHCFFAWLRASIVSVFPFSSFINAALTNGLPNAYWPDAGATGKNRVP